MEVFCTIGSSKQPEIKVFDPLAKMAVVFVNGFNGLGIHTTLGIVRIFPGIYKNFIFVEIGVVDAGNFRGSEEITYLEENVSGDVQKYAKYRIARGFRAESRSVIGPEIITTAFIIARELAETYSNVTFFGGQLVFKHET